MNIFIYLASAAGLGLLVSLIIRGRSPLVNIIVAVLGGFLAGYFISPLLNFSLLSEAVSLATMVVVLIGAGILLTINLLISRRPPPVETVDSKPE